jgi:putative spermidine/putrescine transport system permease protein
MSRRTTIAALLIPGGVLLAFGFLLPFVGTLVTPPAIEPGSVYFSLGELLQDDFALGVLLRTIRVAAVVTVVCAMLGYPVAYLIAHAPVRIRGPLLVLSVFPLLLSTVVRTYAWLVILGRNGMVSSALQWLGFADGPVQLLYTEFALVVGLTQLFLPIMILSAYSSVTAVDERLDEAARGLGATPGRSFRLVVWPLTRPGVLVGATLVFAGSVTAFTTPLLLGGTQNRMLSTLLYDYANVTLDWHAASAVAIVMTVLVLVVGYVATRFARTAVTA